MMGRSKTILLLFCLLLILPASANAVLIVNTGPGPNITGGASLNAYQWLAAEFSITDSYTLTGIEGWMNEYNQKGGLLDIALYADGGAIPLLSNQLYHQAVNVSQTTAPGWYGLDGLSWDLDPGSYWVAFEVHSSGFSGSMPTPAGDPLAAYAFASGSPMAYHSANYLGLAIRIDADAAPIPEPATLLLVATGIAGLGGLRRRRRRG